MNSHYFHGMVFFIHTSRNIGLELCPFKIWREVHIRDMEKNEVNKVHLQSELLACSEHSKRTD